jgi:hypothetical protein
MPVSDIGAIYTPSIYGRTSFPIRYQREPIFLKTFDGSSSDIVGLSSDKIYVKDHFFKTGERLTYSPGTGTSIGITTTSPGNIGFSSYLPSTVYPIVVDKDNIRVALASSLALSGDYVNINATGIGSAHTLLAEKQNAKSLICIDNIIQSPISVGSTVGIVTYTNTSLTLDTLENVKLGSLIRISNGTSNEISKVSAINFTTKQVSISRGTGVMGTPQLNFNDSITSYYGEVLSGNYNIVKDVIYFSDPPLEGRRVNILVPISDIDFTDSSFTYFTGSEENIITGSQAVFYSENPPVELENGAVYFLIRSANNTFKLADSLFNAFNGNEIEFSSNSGNAFPVGAFQLFLILSTENSSFQGRVFLRSNYDGNYVFDDISEQFTGITSSFELKVSGLGTVGISSDNGIVLINNTFQYPESEEAFEYREVGSQTFIDFKGSADTKTYDVNVGGLPRGGIIVSFGSSSGSLYQPLEPAEGFAVVSAAGTVSNVYITNPGSGYRLGITTYYVELYNAEIPGYGALAVAYPNSSGIITGVGILTGGQDYQYNGESTTLTNTIALLDPNGTPIGVGTTSIFEYFRGELVSINNPGYVIIDDEIIKYTGISNSTSELTGTLRGQFGTLGAQHLSSVPVTKYEYNYISKFDAPSPYDNVPLIGSSAGIGASVRFNISISGEITDLEFTNRGYNYRVGEVLVPDGVLGLSTQTDAEKLKISVEEVAKDEFSAWNIGKLRKLEDLTSKVNGVRTIFTLLETVQTPTGLVTRRTSLESDPASGIDLSYNLLVFVNDILQIPNISYVFLGGSQLEFTEAPPVGSDIKVYFYEGFDGDAEFFQAQTDVKEGDKVQIQRDIFEVPPLEQKQRTAKRAVSSDTIRTEIYSDRGLSESSSQRRSISWTPQKSDAIINGEYVFKSRDKLSSGISSIFKLSLPIYSGITTIGFNTTADGTFSGVSTNIIGINTNSGIGSLVQIGDYVEGSYVAIGVTIVSIGSSIIDIGSPSVGISTGSNSFIGLTSYSSSPLGINTIPLSFYRKI